MRFRVATLVLVLLLAGCTGRTGTGNPATGPQQNSVSNLPSGVFPVDDREPAPALSGRTLGGEDLDLSTLRGQVVVLNFWASWCAPCIAEARNLNSVFAQTKALGVAFVGIDIKDDRTKAQAFERKHQVAYPSLFDPEGRLLLKFAGKAPQQPPTTLILDREGRVAARFLSAVTMTQLLGPVQVLANERA